MQDTDCRLESVVHELSGTNEGSKCGIEKMTIRELVGECDLTDDVQSVSGRWCLFLLRWWW